MIIPTTTAKERMKTRQPHAKRITSVISSFTSHRPISHAKRLPPYRLQQKPERMSRTDQPNNLCRGRLSLFLFPLCISLTVFSSHHSTFKTKERIKLTYSSAKVLRVLNGKTRSSRSGFEKNLPCAINGTRYFFQKPCFS